MVPHRPAPGNHRPSERLGGFADELFIRIAGLAAQLMVEMRHRQLPAAGRRQAVQQRQQRH